MNQTGNQLYVTTSSKIQDCFLLLLGEKPFSQITIQEICRLAQINRSTFYRHYEDIFALMQDIEHKVFSDFISNLRLHDFSSNYFSQELLTEVLQHIKKYSSFYTAFLSSSIQDTIFDKHPELWDRYLVSLFQQYGVENQRHMHYYFSFFKAGFLHCITKWLEEGCPESPEELASIIWKYTMH